LLFDRFVGEHAVDGKVGTKLAQKLQILQLTQPIVVVDQDGIILVCFAKPQELAKHPTDPGNVRFNVECLCCLGPTFMGAVGKFLVGSTNLFAVGQQ